MPDSVPLIVYWLPLIGAMLFAGAAILTRKAASFQLDIWLVCFVSNLVTAVAFQFLLLINHSFPSFELWWQPALVSGLFVLGQVLTLNSLAKGDISISAPVLGLKVVFVPFLIRWLSGTSLPTMIWFACGLATVGIALLNFSRGKSHSRRLFSLCTAGGGAAAYAMFDVCVQLRSPEWSQGAFLSTVFVGSTILSSSFLRATPQRLQDIPAAAWPALLGSGACFALQSLCIVCTIAFWGHASIANVMYATRGLWSLLLVSLLGTRLGIREPGLTHDVFWIRFVGATILLVAIACLKFG
ncbi:MAG: hypothetical protein KDB03_18010 [Planctomycetales bacterium]|nr:hypothetical protein [Planctomycetales bacterium]